MKVLIVLSIFFSLTFAYTRWFELESYSFEKYTKEYSKGYSSEEYERRRSIFEENLKAVRLHNMNDTYTWKKGINHLSDRTEEEFRKMLGGKPVYNPNKRYEPVKEVSLDTLPTSVDWRTTGIITSVKDQGECGSCWAFGTAETIESYWAMATGHLTDLSEQQILDCVPNPNDCGGTGGCGGGTPELAYAHLMVIGGITSEWRYSYNSYYGTNYQCNNRTSPLVQLSGYKVLPSNTYSPVLQALANVGPLAINVDASVWSTYETGVFDGCNQVNPDIDHVVQLVGYGTDTSFGDYWLVRNSWSPIWGENGYIRLRRDTTLRCGTDLQPSDGTGCNGGPSKVTVCGTCGLLYDVSYPIISTK